MRNVVPVALLTFGAIASIDAAHASESLGEWVTQGHSAHVRIERCPNATDRFCGTITWLWEPLDVRGAPILDAWNPDRRLRSRPVLGLQLLQGFRESSGGLMSDGRIYNPENGRTYEATLRLRAPDVLEVKGCVLFLCETQVWRRVEAVCAKPIGLRPE